MEGISDSNQTWKTALTVACFVPWCSMSHCLIWHSAATRLFGFVTLCGPSAPVPSIVSEFSIFGKKLGSFNWCAGLCFFDFRKLSFNSSNLICLNHLLLLTCSKRHDSTWEDYAIFLTRVSKCHVVPCMLLTRCIARSSNNLLCKAQEK